MKDMTASGMTDPDLWGRIRTARLRTSREGREFAANLARFLAVPTFEAREIEQEYRRFLYLSSISSDLCVPPASIRIAWALHANGPDYARFCETVLGKPLPYDDAARQLGASTAYRRTRKEYQREFNEIPARIHWPDGIKPRLPRWLWAHAALLGTAGYAAWVNADPMLLAIGLFLSLALYGADLFGAFRMRHGTSMRDAVSDDLNHFLTAGR